MKMGWLAALVLFSLAMPLHADFRPTPIGTTTPVPGPVPHPTFTPAPVLSKSALCKRECVNGILSLTYLESPSDFAAATCPTHPDVTIACGGYACDPNGKLCKTGCAAEGDCSAAHMCVSGSCVPAQNRCSDDFMSVIGADGKTYSCGLYRCNAGRCNDRCTVTDECANGKTCDPSTGQCVST